MKCVADETKSSSDDGDEPPRDGDAIAYFHKMPNEGLYYLNKPGDDGYTTRVFVSGAAVCSH